ncbi:Mitochondrial distribution and morphology protein 34 [Hirsutella minnesotensis 3608]|uniref:Mitochondrial distribution and morphology protein 34 n=1 Tax=Hirsutella minnesotensis 3608 TaxID=1043627 RepID=A0A0F7ZMK8_9HYPO|nr:Mitochondrial distribution and morphology protein 34 [Hirsutella minnesotensis 3608]
MAFNFNWSPLTADADFYRRARDLLTKALNKSPKPPIIVDDILVSELNLGTVPPDLEILEIGDLAEDRFRGIFKMCYSGDAFLTLKTRVQANPLNTYLYSKPSFTSPQPLAAASGLTIPLSITLSEIKLSAFIILVFSKQKGLTLVFRNDPLESLKVSSTFDSIQFVRDYLQRTIEQQLRNLMMEELPAIIHRLSLQLWCPDQANKGAQTPQDDLHEEGIDPFASPPLDPVDANGNLLDPNAVSELSLNGGGEVQSLFSQKNLLRLAALTDCHRTLSLFTPGIRDVVFRAWTGYGDRSESVTPPLATPSLTRTYSFPNGGCTTYTFSDTSSTVHDYAPSRASIASLNSAPGVLPSSSAYRTRSGRKKKTRVVNLRRPKPDTASVDSASETTSDTVSVNVNAPLSEPLLSTSIPEEPETEANEVPTSHLESHYAQSHPVVPSTASATAPVTEISPQQTISSRSQRAVSTSPPPSFTTLPEKISRAARDCNSSDTSSVILEQAWIMKMAGEIARRVYDEKRRRQSSVWDEAEHPPPPAYEATAL